MGIDLRLIIVRDRHREWWLERNTLDLDRDYALHHRIKEAETPKQLPQNVTLSVYDEERGLCTTKDDSYGEPLTWIESKAFGSVPIVTEYSNWNRAVITFLKMLPRDIAVVLWWH